MDLTPLKTAIRDRLQDFQDQVRRRAPGALYHTLSAATVVPILSAMGVFGQSDSMLLVAASQAFGQMAAGLGGNLLANQVEAWKNKSKAEVTNDLEQLIQTDERWRTVVQQVVEQVGTLELAQVGLSEADRRWLVDALNRELAQRGASREITVGDQGILVWGDRNVIVETMHNPVIQTGDRATYIKEQRIDQAIFQAPPPPVDDTPQVWLTAYLEGLFDQMGKLDLAIIERRKDSERQTNPDLAAVYTHLDVLRVMETGRGRKGPGHAPRREEPDLGEGKRQSALDFVNGAKLAALLGDPGSGKTTFAQYLALCLAGERLRRPEANLTRLAGWTHGVLLPVLVTLRRFVAGEQTILWDYIESDLGRRSLDELAPHLKTVWRREGGLLILDGFDEVPDALNRRDRVKDAVTGFRRDFPKVRILLTCRTYAYEELGWRLPDFDEARLAPFDDEQIDYFIQHWYEHLAERRPGLRPEDTTDHAEKLQTAIRQRPHLRELAERPLLLTLMATLHASSAATLPDSREKLYEESVELLLNYWEKEKWKAGPTGPAPEQHASLAEWLRITPTEAQRALEKLAYEVHRDQPDRKGTADIPEDKLAGVLLAAGRKQTPDMRLQHIIDYIQDRAGLLIHRADGFYAFPHRTFQEYLAARHLSDLNYPYALVDHVREDTERWREATLLAAAKAGRGSWSNVWSLARCLCPEAWTPGRAGTATEADWLAVLLAGQALVETGVYRDLHPTECPTLDIIRWSLATLVSQGRLGPVDRATAGRALAVLGDPREGIGVKDGIPDIVWVTIRPGPFLMGSKQGQKVSVGDESYTVYNDETPQFECRLITQPYRISRYPITVAQYTTFVQAGGYENKDYWTPAGWIWRRKNNIDRPKDYDAIYQTPNHPQVGVSWYEAVAFCHWLAEVLGKPKGAIRLPSEAQWERAGRGTDGRLWPWGDVFDPDACNAVYSNIGTTCTVGMFPKGDAPPGAEGYGPADMAGNVWEWCQTVWRDNYKGYEKSVDDKLTSDGSRVLRGGAFVNLHNLVRCAYRYGSNPVNRHDDVGFRLVSLGL